MNSKPRRRAPVPERDWAEQTLPSLRREESFPKINF